jgi:hypothetical protein
VIAEGNETPGGEPGGAAEGRGRRSEGDLLAERRARRAAESGEHALTLRAEAAEATVRTLETHVASLRQRLSEAEEEQRRMTEPIDAGQPTRGGGRSEIGQRAQAPAVQAVLERELERELQRASQREYAEQRLRVEAEDRCVEIERDARAEIERLSRRLSAGEREARALGARLETVQRELAEAEQAAATELADLRSEAAARTERALQARLAELERRTLDVHRRLEAERSARERAERLLEALRRSHRAAAGLLSELGAVVARLKDAAASAPALSAHALAAPPAPREAPAPERPGAPRETQSSEMAEALAAAVERLRARVEQHPEQAAAPSVRRPPHKHSMSLITRWRIALRQRRERRKQRLEG